MKCKERMSVLFACITLGHGQFGPAVLLCLVDATVEVEWWCGANILVECSFGSKQQLEMASG